MSSIRSFRAVTLILIAVILIGACAPAAPSGTVSFMVSGDPAELKAYQSLVAAFEQKNPSIKVELIHIPSSGDYSKRLSADFAANTPANVVLINYRRYAGFAAKGVLEPVGPYLAKSTVIKEADFYSEAIEPFKWEGVLTCVPQNISSLVVYYNQTLFDTAGLPYPKPDWKWDDFLATAQALTKDTNGDGTPDQYGLGTEAALIRVAPFIWQNGGDLTATPVTTRLTIDTAAAKAAIQWFVDLQAKYHVVPDAAAEKSESSEDRFINGRLGMYLDSRRVTPTFRESAKFNWDVAPLPNHELGPATILHSDSYCMTKATQNKEAAWKFIEFANSTEGQSIVSSTGRLVPSLKTVAQSSAFLDPNAKPKSSQVWIDAIPSIRSVPIMKNWADIEDVFGAELERAFYQGATVDDVVKAIIDRTQVFMGEKE